jgi:putative ABC transport system permease protein
MQLFAVSGLSLRSLRHRIGSSLVVVIGIAGVVAVFISVLSLATGFRRTIANTGRPDRAVVLTRGDSEGGSSISRDDVRAITDAPGIKVGAAGKHDVSAETIALAPVAKKGNGSDAFITVRGVGPAMFATRTEVKLVGGRMFRAGLHEILVGRAARQQFSGLEIGDQVRLGDGDWTVVGSFSSDGNSLESTLIADADTLLAAYKRNTFSSVTVRLDSPEMFTRFREALTANPTLVVDAWREPEYFSSQTQPLNRMLNLVAFAISGIMAVGAVFAALNTMHSAVSGRMIEIATLRAVGFSGFPVVVSVVIEALLLSLIGAAIGVAIAFVLFDGRAISTVGDLVGNNPQLVYSLKIGLVPIGLSVALACGIGLLGGLFPGVWVARVPVAEALRSS